MIHVNQIFVQKKSKNGKKDLSSLSPTASQQRKSRDRDSTVESDLDRAREW